MHSIAKAPFRIDLGGGISDIPAFSQVMQPAIASIAVDLFYDAQHTKQIRSSAECTVGKSNTHKVSINGRALHKPYLAKHQFITTAFQRSIEHHKITQPVTLDFFSELPVSTGLGGSAVATLSIVAAAAGSGSAQKFKLNKIKLLKFAHQLETKELGVTSGFQDYISAGLGGYNFIEFKKLTKLNSSLLGNPLGKKLSNSRATFLDKNMIVVLQKSGVISSTIIVEEEIQMLNDQPNRTKTFMQTINRSNHIINQMLIQNESEINWSLFGTAINKSWEAQKKLSKSLINRSELAQIEEKVGSKVLGMRGPGAGGNSLFLLADPKKRNELDKILNTIGDNFLVLYCGINNQGLELVINQDT